MKVILLSDVKKVGQRGSVVTVADGYAQNVLLPKKFAVAATEENLLRQKRSKEGVEAHHAANESLAKEAIQNIEGKTVILHVRANDSGGLFQAIRQKEIADAIEKEFHIILPEDAIRLDEPIKKLGSFPVRVSLCGFSTTVLAAVEV